MNKINDIFIVKKKMPKKNKLLNNSFNFNRNFQNITFATSKTESSSTKNTLYINNKPYKINKNNNNNYIDYSEYFKINNKSEKKIINNLNRYNIQNQNFFISKNINNQNKIILNRTYNFNKNISAKDLDLNLYYIGNNLNDGNNDIKMIYNKTGDIIDNDIKDNINKMKKEEELVYLRNVLKKLKVQNKKIENEFNAIKNENLKIENNIKNKNKMIYRDIKNIFINNEKNIQNNNNQINTDDLLNFYKIKFGSSISFKEKLKLLREIYLNEKLKNSLVEKSNKLFIENNLLKPKDKNESNKNINLNNIQKCIINLLENINRLKKKNDEIEIYINNKAKEKNMYKYYYYNWIKNLRIKTKEDLQNKIKDLIIDQNYNDIEEIKLYNILMNKKKP